MAEFKTSPREQTDTADQQATKKSPEQGIYKPSGTNVISAKEQEARKQEDKREVDQMLEDIDPDMNKHPEHDGDREQSTNLATENIQNGGNGYKGADRKIAEIAKKGQAESGKKIEDYIASNPTLSAVYQRFS